jgi:predicted metalloprotease with PDZ domain
MSEFAPFADGAVFPDATDANRTFLTYYTYGAGIALALDFSLRDMSGGKLSLDDYMKLLWAEHRKDGPAPGLVSKPYTLQDLKDYLGKLTGNPQFANDFFTKYIEGHDVPDYRRLLALAGYSLDTNVGKGWLGNVPVSEAPDGLAVGVATPPGGGLSRPFTVPFNTPLYDAGIDSGDTIKTIDGQPATPAAWRAIANRKPSENVTLGVLRRGGEMIQRTITLKDDPTVRVGVVQNLSAAQKAFRDSWLATKAK